MMMSRGSHTIPQRTSKSIGAQPLHNEPAVGNLKNFGLSYLSKQRPFAGFKRTENEPARAAPAESLVPKVMFSEGGKKSNTNEFGVPEGPVSKANYNPQCLEQLYKGEKARNAVLNKQVNDLKLQLKSFDDDVKEAKVMKEENEHYKQLILKYE